MRRDKYEKRTILGNALVIMGIISGVSSLITYNFDYWEPYGDELVLAIISFIIAITGFVIIFLVMEKKYIYYLNAYGKVKIDYEKLKDEFNKFKKNES